MSHIYVLQLQNKRYYVGRTDDIAKRFNQHVSGYGSAWTRKYKPLRIMKSMLSTSLFDEDKYTKEMMAKYGIDNVRGGSYVEVILNETQIETLQTEIWSAKNLCSRCGRSGHFIKDCYAKTVITDVGQWCCEYCEKPFESEYQATLHEKGCRKKLTHIGGDGHTAICFRCGRPGHYSPECYASTHIKGYYLQ